MKKIICFLLIAFALSMSFTSCKPNKGPTQNSPPPGALQLWSNVHVIDSTQWILNSSTNPNIYRYTFTPSTPYINVHTGDIIIGAANGGYIRKVTATSVIGNVYQLVTSQATMADVFKSGSFSFTIPMNDPNQSNPGVSRSFFNFPVFKFHPGNFTMQLLNAQMDIQPSWYFNFAYDTTGLTNFQMSTTNASLKDSIRIGITGVSPYVWSHDTTLGTFTTNRIQWVTAWTPTGNISVPVVVQLNLAMLANGSGGSSHSDTINTIVNWATKAAFTGGLKYTGGMWQALHSSVATNSVSLDTSSKNNFVYAKLTLLSQISAKFFSVAGPQITIGYSGYLFQAPTSTRAFSKGTGAWTTATDAQPGIPIMGKNISTFTQSWTSDSVIFQTPYLLSKMAGDNQSGNIILQLPNPLVVKVTDSNGNPVSNVYVTFAVTYGGGSLSAYNVQTDQNGLAQTLWTLGPILVQQGNQTVTATAKDGYNQPLLGAPVSFTAQGH